MAFLRKANPKKASKFSMEALWGLQEPSYVKKPKLYLYATWVLSGQLTKSSEKFQQFTKAVNTFQKNYKIAPHPFNSFDSFKEMVSKRGQTVGLWAGGEYRSVLKSKTEQGMRRAYTAYWIDQMIRTHNIKRADAARLYEKHKNGQFVSPLADVVKPGKTKKYETVSLDNIFELADLSGSLSLRTNPKLYAKIEQIPTRYKNIIYDFDQLQNKDVRTLKNFKNLDTLWFSNFFYAIQKAGWSSQTIDLIKRFVDNNHLQDLYKIFEQLNSNGDLDFTWKYKEKMGDAKVKTEEDKFYSLLFDKYINSRWDK